ncbi:hypothetical protein Tco_0831144 [Tanacetum coccineum]
MQDCKPISAPFPTNVKLPSNMSPSSEKERVEMSRVSYGSEVGSLMFTMICTRLDIAHALGVVSRYMAEPGDLDGSKSTTGTPAFHSKIKHIQVQYHFVHEKVEEGTMDMRKIHTDDSVADYLTKAINGDKFIWRPSRNVSNMKVQRRITT